MIKPLLSTEWFSRLSHFNRLIIGFSGGLDSTVLLHVLASHPTLLTRLIAVHVNHGISANASCWQLHCQQFCQNLGIPLITQGVQFDRSANIEEGARIARYAVFSSLLAEEDCLLLGHHLNDQAETVLLQLFRGSGVDGLAAMPDFGQLALGKIARPFLTHSREELEHYAAFHQLSWIEDESNEDIGYSRNYLRQQIMPLLKRKWPGVIGNIARTALHCQQAKRNLDMLAAQDMASEENLEKLTGNSLLITPLKALGRDRIANVLRVWLKNNKIQLPSTVTFWRLIDEVIFASPDAVPLVSWGEVTVRRYQKHLYLDNRNANNLTSYIRPLSKLAAKRDILGDSECRTAAYTKSHEDQSTISTKQICSAVEFHKRSIEWSAFPLPLVIPNSSINLLAKKDNQGLVIPAGAKIFVQFRQGGEEFFLHGQTKRLKKLFQEWGVPPWLRERIPLIYFNDKLAAVVGYAMSDLFFIEECPDAWTFVNCSV
ncbi:tRNA lysidine(34) synthetase TilS [Legionella parisiensis]|uniref:tRNA(Ile)-lysidine synthase n=1 Tax=Legionella parisiensis TaxID=45071 RepID=A0A1E5JSI5_9GAMM|nr:tRNA lysidine(34) synthetase TilS [Legionella parisiensis]KTD44726.1 cell cycle protein MesJ [Legionella parisiensis]OEH47475.1 tRNA(Ile)-lysidine synthase [Legionella parisiensis]STX76910.1 cell cycle protein MesJ [Legionella parisiensis]